MFLPISNDEEANCFFYVEENFIINQHPAFKRTVFIPENPFGDSYKYYMNEILDIRAPSFSLSKKILEFLQNDIKSLLLEEQCWKYIKSLPFYIKNQEIYMNDLKVFFVLQSQLDNIKIKHEKRIK